MKTSVQSIQQTAICVLTAFFLIIATSGYSQPINKEITDPVQNFSVQQVDARINLSWTVNTDMSLSHFILEKSVNGKDFKEVAVIFAYEKEANKADYGFPDKARANETTVIYRLVLVEAGGKSSYSKAYSFNLK